MEEVKKKRSWLKIGCLSISAIVLLTVIIGGISIWLYVRNLEKKNQKDVTAKGELVVKLLDERYHDKFAIADGKFIWATDAYQFTAYPVNEPDFKFMVLISRLSKSGISCDYLYQRRRFDLMKQSKPYIDALTEKNFYTTNPCEAPEEINGKFIRSLSNEIIEYESNPQVTLDDVLRKYSRFFKAYIGITYCYDVTDENKEKIAKDIYKLLCFYREKKFGIIDLSIYFYKSKCFNDERFKKEAEKQPAYPSYISSNNSAEYEPDYCLNICERHSDTDKISDYKEVVKFLNKIDRGQSK